MSLDKGYLIAIGGAEDKSTQCRILTHFVELCGGSKARIAVIPAASGYPVEMEWRYCEVFTRLGAGMTDCLHICDRQLAEDAELIARLKQATGIFLTGGDQLKLMSLIGGTRLAATIQTCFARGVHVAGTSAGASALSRQMIAFGRSGEFPSQRMVQLALGLGFAERLIIDQHFSQRNRLGRLLTAVALNPGMIGVGIDEDTALVTAPNGAYEVIGSGKVTFVDGRHLTYTDIYAAKRHDPVTVAGVDIQAFAAGEPVFPPVY
jgi:cyanophycinase